MTSPYGKPKYQDMQGESLVSQMRRLVALKWAKATQPRPVVKFTGTIAAKVAGKQRDA